jgi:hypothetical protein
LKPSHLHPKNGGIHNENRSLTASRSYQDSFEFQNQIETFYDAMLIARSMISIENSFKAKTFFQASRQLAHALKRVVSSFPEERIRKTKILFLKLSS